MVETSGITQFWQVIEDAAKDPKLAQVRPERPKMGEGPSPFEIPDTAVQRLNAYRVALAEIRLPESLRTSSNLRFLSIIILSIVYLICVVLIVYLLRGSNNIDVVLGAHTSAVVVFLVALRMLIKSDQQTSTEELRRQREEGFINAILLLAPSFDSKTMLLVLREMEKLKPQFSKGN